MSIYFPPTRATYDPWYSTFVRAFPGAMADWDTFLRAIYNLGDAIASGVSQSEGRVGQRAGAGARTGAVEGLLGGQRGPQGVQGPRSLHSAFVGSGHGSSPRHWMLEITHCETIV